MTEERHPETGRPLTVAEILRFTVGWLDLGDKAMTTVVRAKALETGDDLSKALDTLTNRAVQQDLTTLADWLDAHPDEDALLYGALG